MADPRWLPCYYKISDKTRASSNEIYFYSCKKGCDNIKERWNEEFGIKKKSE